jgi:hypothetical protein
MSPKIKGFRGLKRGAEFLLLGVFGPVLSLSKDVPQFLKVPQDWGI